MFLPAPGAIAIFARWHAAEINQSQPAYGELPALGSSGFLVLVAAAGRTPALFQGRQPGWWTSPPPAPATRQTLQRYDGLFNLLALVAQFRQHFQNIHGVLLAPFFIDPSCTSPFRKTNQKPPNQE